MRILLSTDNFYPNINGASYATQHLAYELKKRGHDVAVIAPSRTFKDETYDMDGVAVYGIRSLPLLGRIRYALPFFVERKVGRIINSFKPDIVHLQSHFFVSAATARVALRQNLPAIGTNHFMPENLLHYLHLPKYLEQIVWRIAWNHFLRTYNTLEAVTTPTGTALNLLKGIGLTRPLMYAVSNGIDCARFNPQRNGALLRKKYHIPDELVLLSVSRLDKEKNLDLVIAAAADAMKQTPFTLIIAGGGNERENLAAEAAHLGIAEHVIFPGIVPDVELPDLYAAANVFVMAGTAELQSLVTMEAMATKLPIIAANALALPELVENGANGFLFPPGDQHTLTKAIIVLMKDPVLRDTMGQKSLEKIAIHENSQVIKSYETIYADIIARQMKK